MAPKPPNHANPLRVAAAQGNGRIAARSRNRRLVPARLAADEHWRPLGQPGVKGLAGSLRSVGERAALCARFERSSPTAVRFRPRGAMVHRGGSGVVRWLSTKRWLAPPPPMGENMRCCLGEVGAPISCHGQTKGKCSRSESLALPRSPPIHFCGGLGAKRKSEPNA